MKIENKIVTPKEIDFAAESFARILIEQALSKKSNPTDIDMEKKYGKSN